MDDKALIDDIVKMLDSGFANGVGHVNVDTDNTLSGNTVETMGCADCSKNPLACSVPTLQEGLDDKI
ncbi:MAG: hypothetical protein GX234_05345 [Clostridiales bacterium]|nr:hypothetical protein [Clostridiales bacterium]